jgi:predicted glycosyltransferase
MGEQSGVTRHPSIVLYSHDGFGLGHLRRTTFLARCIREREPPANILIVCSSPAPPHVTGLDGFEHVKLPSVTDAWQRYFHCPDTLAASRLDQVIALRSDLLLTVVQQVRPDLLLIDHQPLGLRGEALPALHSMHQQAPRGISVLGLRDIMDDPATVKRRWSEQDVYGALDQLYDAILVYGDERIFDCRLEYSMPEHVARKVQFVGYVVRHRLRRSRDSVRRELGVKSGDRLVVVSTGGGADGHHLTNTFLSSVTRLPPHVHSLVVTGPLMNEADRKLLRTAEGSPVTVAEFRDDLASDIGAADLSISMGGDNTIMETLNAGVPALVIPRANPGGAKEQLIRAQRLAAHGLIDMMLPTELTEDRLVARISTMQSPPHEPKPIDLDGGRQTADFICSLLKRTPETGAAPRADENRHASTSSSDGETP